MNVVDVARSLRGEATETNERRLLVLAGDRERGYDRLEAILDAIDVSISGTTLVGPNDRLRCEQLSQSTTGRLLGTTREVIVLDAHAQLRPNALGRVVGAVDGGGLLVLLTPPLEAWPTRRDGFDETLAVPPYDVADVTGRFRSRLVDTLRAHRGIAVVDIDDDRVVEDGLTNPAPRVEADATVEATPEGLPDAVIEACLTTDQAEAVVALESLAPGGRADSEAPAGPRAVVLEADRGRGKSSAAGIAAGRFAADGLDVLFTAPARDNVAEAFDRARELCSQLDVCPPDSNGDERAITTTGGGRVRYLQPTAAVDDCADVDVVIVDEAASLPVSTLEALLAADRIAFATTVHGYEGAGRGFSVRFRDRLAESDHEVIERTLLEPIRYAAGDPVEVWAFRALLLDARPPVEPLIAAATPETVEYRPLDPADLLADEHLLREAFGLLVLAHYRTEPTDLARLLDAPNLEARALCHEGHVASVALLAREGDLDEVTRAHMYEGGRVRGNMLPDVLTSQLRDEDAGRLGGVRVMRIATHHAVRSRGLGSLLLERVRDEFASRVDWLGSGFGATPSLLSFWRENGYGTVHLSTTRNDASGEHSAIVLSPTSEAGEELRDRHADWFARRFPAICADSLREADPAVLRAAIEGADAHHDLSLPDHAWRVVTGAAYGPGLFDVDPGPFRPLVVHYFLADPAARTLTDREERLLVRRVLQGDRWHSVADALEYHSTGQCMRAFGDALQPLVDRFGTDVALDVRDRFVD